MRPIHGQTDTAALDARILVCHILGIDQAKLLAMLGQPLASVLDSQAVARFDDLWKRRLAGEPVAYLVGRKEFFGLSFRVDRRVLVPRPDTETLVETILEDWPEDRLSGRVLDCCTGSGCIAVALAHERPSWEVWASDISSEALEVARENGAELADGRVRFRQADLLEGFEPGGWRIIASNPPYLTIQETELRRAAGWVEPELALVSGSDGLDHVRRLVRQAADLLEPGGCLYIESSPTQTESIQGLLSDAEFTDIYSVADLAGAERVTRGRR